MPPEPQLSAMWAARRCCDVRRLGPTPAPLTRVFPWLHVRLDDKPRCYGYAAFQSTA